MHRYIALLRGINVGGKNALPMSVLQELFVDLGCEHVRTYIQSGNVVFDSRRRSTAGLSKLIREAINRRHCIDTSVLVLSKSEFASAIDNNPFPQATVAPSTLHFFFLENIIASPNNPAIESLQTSTERYELVGRVFYLHAPDGIGRSKLAANVEKRLGVAATSRNYRTVKKLGEMSAE